MTDLAIGISWDDDGQFFLDMINEETGIPFSVKTNPASARVMQQAILDDPTRRIEVVRKDDPGE